MSESGQNRIWRPNVEPNENPLPFPSSAASAQVNGSGSQRQHQVYTKTSLIANKDNNNHLAATSSYNRAVLTASQSYNSSPKPFRRQDQVGASTNQLPSVSFTNWNQQQVSSLKKEFSASSQRLNESHQLEAKRMNLGARAESMSPKLVHKQYNSPLDLYSMNNIRKTIEAHTELIAPGVKGINFMKKDTPIKEQSEVYKLIKEEEEQRAHQMSSSRLSPISGQPLKLPSGLQHQQHQQQQQSHEASSEQSKQTTRETCAWANRQQSSNLKAGCPVCCECGQSIVGPFAKIGARFVHPHCFNCTTCGTSLKNTGYFTIEDKLYCEIHAKQVANMMRIPFNFDTNQQQQQQTGLSSSGGVSSHQEEQRSRHEAFEHSEQCTNRLAAQQQSTNSNTLRPLVTFGSPATISTMFANRTHSQECLAHNEQKYSRAASVNEVSLSQQQQHNQQQQKFAGGRAEATSAVNRRLFAGQQSTVSTNTTTQQDSRRYIQESCQAGLGGRLPVCVNCNAQIHGPYILASQTTWCKHCSQNHFNCSSCNRSLLDVGFIEDGSHRYYCENCFEVYCAPVCAKCNLKIKGDCLNALQKKWHPSCFTCGHCRRPFGNSSFYLEDNVPYCERDWRALFTTKCYSCSFPIEAGDKWIEALDRNYHSSCFRCTACQANLEGSTFYRKGDKPYCRLHAR